MVMRGRPGASKLGCLAQLVILVIVAYVGLGFAEVYWRYSKFRYEIREQVRLAGHRTDDQILRRLQAVADSLELPPEAHQIYLHRDGRRITIAAEYWEYVEFPRFSREIHLQPYAEGTY